MRPGEHRQTYVLSACAASGSRRRVTTSDVGGCGDRKKREGESGESGETREHLVCECKRLRRMFAEVYSSC